jgi:hypothetical protein
MRNSLMFAAVAALAFSRVAGATQPTAPTSPFRQPPPMALGGPYRLIKGKCFERDGITGVHLQYCKTKKQGGWSVPCIDPVSHKHAFCG